MSVLYLFGTALVAWAATGAFNHFALGPWRKARTQGAHWTECARLLYPAHIAAANSCWVIPANLALAFQILDAKASPHWLLVAIAGSLGAVLGNRALSSAVYPGLSHDQWLHQATAGWIVQFFGWLLLLAGIALMPKHPSWMMVAVTGLYIGGQALFVWKYGAMLRVLRLLKPAAPPLLELVAQVSKRMHVKVSHVWMLVTPSAFAAALPNTGELLFSQRLLELLEGPELAAVCAHEIGHLSESKGTVFLRFVSSLYFLPLLFLSPLMEPMGAPGLAILGFAVAGGARVARALSRHLEVRADKAATMVEAEGPTYARALEKLHETNQIPAVFPERQQTHPHLYDRMLAAGVEPAYPRPEPAQSIAAHGHILAGLFGILAVIYVFQTLSAFTN